MNEKPIIENVTSDQGITTPSMFVDVDGHDTLFVEASAIGRHVDLYRDALHALTRAMLNDLRRGYGLHDSYTDDEVVNGLMDLRMSELASALKAALVILALGDKSRAQAK